MNSNLIFPIAAIGIATIDRKENILDVLYTDLFQAINAEHELLKITKPLMIKERESCVIQETTFKEFHHNKVFQSELPPNKVYIATYLAKDKPITSTESAYLKLHLLSSLISKPNSLNLEGIFNALPNNAWTNLGPISLHEIKEKIIECKASSTQLEIFSIDKFPRMSDYVVPEGVRIADSSRVRLGAYLAPGTTVMHEGFVNFNAGTLGPCMVEGRISAGVTIDSNSDIGGGASTMGTLSGGNNIKISLGKRSLIGANAGLGIPLGDDCTIEAGLYITAGTKVKLILNDKEQIVKASELAGSNNLLFRRNSTTGAVEAITNKKSIELNQDLHMNS